VKRGALRACMQDGIFDATRGDWNGLTLLELRSGSKPALPESCTFLANYFTPSDRPPLIQAVFETDPLGVRTNGAASPRTNSANVDRSKMKLEGL
jgi:hypothetical protein